MKLIVHAEPEDFILAVRAAKWLVKEGKNPDVLLCFEGGRDFYVRRNKASVTVRDVSKNSGGALVQTKGE